MSEHQFKAFVKIEEGMILLFNELDDVCFKCRVIDYCLTLHRSARAHEHPSYLYRYLLSVFVF